MEKMSSMFYIDYSCGDDTIVVGVEEKIEDAITKA